MKRTPSAREQPWAGVYRSRPPYNRLMTFPARSRLAWQLRSRVLPLGERTLLMAIVNLTPDSFSGDGLGGLGFETAVAAVCAAVDGGADIVDLGAESTRPGASPLSADEEQARLLPVLSAALRARPEALISVDTYHAATAQAAVACGAEIVNDVSGLQWDPAMAGVLAEAACGLVLMHTRGRPGEWNALPPMGHAEMRKHVVTGLSGGLAIAGKAGIAADRIVLDPGFGFGKKGRENFALLADLPHLGMPGHGLLVGLSRKGFLGDAVRAVQPCTSAATSAADARRNATLAANVAAILGGAHILRVHDLQASREAAAVADEVLAAGVDGGEPTAGNADSLRE